MGRRNPIAKDLYSSKYKKRIVKPKKGKGCLLYTSDAADE